MPPAQIIDTVNIYHLPQRQRKLSLRFLAYAVLHSNIQADTHDSIEDARTALQLYEHYQRLEAEGAWEDTLEDVYREGKQTVRLSPPALTGRVATGLPNCADSPSVRSGRTSKPPSSPLRPSPGPTHPASAPSGPSRCTRCITRRLTRPACIRTVRTARPRYRYRARRARRCLFAECFRRRCRWRREVPAEVGSWDERSRRARAFAAGNRDKDVCCRTMIALARLATQCRENEAASSG